jgi:hypothetical protein
MATKELFVPHPDAHQPVERSLKKAVRDDPEIPEEHTVLTTVTESGKGTTLTVSWEDPEPEPTKGKGKSDT